MAPTLQYLAAGVSIASTIGQASAAEQMAGIEAAQLKKQAIAETASSIQEAKMERMRAQQLSSRVTALSAQSGASGGDINRVLSDIDKQGEYNSLAALYSGATAAASKRYAADVTVAQGKSEKTSGYLKAGATILGTMDKYYKDKADTANLSKANKQDGKN